MKQRVAIGVAVLVGLLGTPAFGGLITVRIAPEEQQVSLSDGQVTAWILADIPESDALIGWGLDLILTGTSVELAPSLPGQPNPEIGPLFDPAYAPDGDGLAALTPPPAGVWGDGVLLATVRLNLVELGETWVDPDYTLDDPFEGLMTASGPASVLFEGGLINVVPEPAGLALLVLVLLHRPCLRR